MRYQAFVRPVGECWAVDFPEHSGVHLQAGTIEEVPVVAADALSLWLDQHITPGQIDVAIVRRA